MFGSPLKIRRRIILILCFAAFFPGCTKSPTGDSDAASGWVLEDERGAILRFEASPHRIISLSPGLTEALYAMNQQARLVGVSRYCRWPEDALRLPRVGGGIDPDLEAVIRLEPDLVISSGSSLTPALARLDSLGIPVALFNQVGIDDALNDMQAVATAIGAGAEAEDLIRSLERKRSELQDRYARLSAADRPVVLILFSTESFLTAGNDTFASEIIALAGGRNAGDRADEPWPVIAPEILLFWNPDVVLFSQNEQAAGDRFSARIEAFLNDPRWSSVSAVRDRRVYTVPDSLLEIPGPRMMHAAATVASLLHEPDPDP